MFLLSSLFYVALFVAGAYADVEFADDPAPIWTSIAHERLINNDTEHFPPVTFDTVGQASTERLRGRHQGQGRSADRQGVIHLGTDQHADQLLNGTIDVQPANFAVSGGPLLFRCSVSPCRVSPVLQVKPYYWGPKWVNPTFTSDVKPGLAEFYERISGTAYMRVLNQYIGPNRIIHDGTYFYNTGSSIPYCATCETCKQCCSGVAFGNTCLFGHWYLCCRTYQCCGLKGLTINLAAKVCSVAQQFWLTGNFWYLPFYADYSRASVGNNDFCGFHGATSCTVNGGVYFYNFAFVFDLRNDTGCRVPYTNGHSPALANLVGVSLHELIESMTDPGGHGWSAANGDEIGDICFKYFSNIHATDGSLWSVQALYSNSSRGCVFS